MYLLSITDEAETLKPTVTIYSPSKQRAIALGGRKLKQWKEKNKSTIRMKLSAKELDINMLGEYCSEVYISVQAE